jgi:hypothetical protein
MELKFNNLEEQLAYDRAVKRVKDLKSFYIHLLVFIVINILIIYINVSNLKPNESYFQIHNFFTLIFWGIGLLAHALSVFLPRLLMTKDWEQRKINEFLDRERLNK